MNVDEARNYVVKSLSDYFLLGNRVFSRVSMNYLLMNMTDEKWKNKEIIECDDEGNEI